MLQVDILAVRLITNSNHPSIITNIELQVDITGRYPQGNIGERLITNRDFMSQNSYPFGYTEYTIKMDKTSWSCCITNIEQATG